MERVSNKDLKRLNSKRALRQFLNEDSSSISKVLRYLNYESRLELLQAELIHLQHWVHDKDKKIVILFEGRDAAGKGGAIRRITEHLNPRQFKVVALPKPTEEEKGQWYFQRYINQLPKKGQIVFFDRSWYNRAVVEPVNDFCTQEEYDIFMNQVNEFERMIIESGITLIKFYFSITKQEQAKRFDDIIASPIKKWKYSKVDQQALRLWNSYTAYKKKMFAQTDTQLSPWVIIKANRKSKARIETIKHILKTIKYEPKDEAGIDFIIDREEQAN
jgi:polyphosphate kinase 2